MCIFQGKYCIKLDNYIKTNDGQGHEPVFYSVQLPSVSFDCLYVTSSFHFNSIA